MENTLPLDQQIVDLYFNLSADKKRKDSAWLLGMIATYGVKPDRLKNSHIQEDNHLLVPGRKNSLPPLHPQWVFLFGLNTYRLSRGFENACYDLYHSMAHNKIPLNITDLLLAHKLRRNVYQAQKGNVMSIV